MFLFAEKVTYPSCQVVILFIPSCFFCLQLFLCTWSAFVVFGFKGLGITVCFIGALNRKHHLNEKRKKKEEKKKQIGERESPILCSSGFSNRLFISTFFPLLSSSNHSRKIGIIQSLFPSSSKKKKRIASFLANRRSFPL